MVFCSTELAARIERAECSMLAQSVAAVMRRRPAERAVCLPLSGGVASYAGPGSPLDKLAGLGFAGPLDLEQLAAAERAFAERDTPLQVELSSLADPSTAPALTRRGYVLVGFENVLGCALPPQPASTPPPGIELRLAGEGELDAWIAVLITAFATPDLEGVPSHESFPREALARTMEDMSGVDGMTRYVACLDGRLVAGAALRLSEGVAQLCGSATLPAYRRRGIQSALLARRLADSGRAGCDLAVVTTQPGSKSQQNVQRRGFELLYTRAILVAPAAPVR
jgi:GNAT superfamily N-acetyltransferase